jgi:hypothetical protein
MKPDRIKWPLVLDRAVEIINEYDTSVTLRQLFYRLVSAGLISNSVAAYTTLSARTAEARREGRFPRLIDRGREIERCAYWDSPAEAVQCLTRQYRRDRTEGQEWGVYLAVEKDGLVTQLQSWFGDYGVPILALRGYCSQTFADDVREDVERGGRRAVVVYGGDYDPSGKDIPRDFIRRTNCWDAVIQVALSRGQVTEYNLPPNEGKAKDTRAARFIREEGELMQVEIDALPPDILHRLYLDAFEQFFDVSTFEEVLEREEADRAELERRVA